MSTLSRSPRARKPAQPVHVKSRWLIEPFVAAPGVEIGTLEIQPDGGEPEEYTLTLGRTPGGAISGVRLTKSDRTQYHVDLEKAECDCPDAQYRKRACKHFNGCTAALKALGQL